MLRALHPSCIVRLRLNDLGRQVLAASTRERRLVAQNARTEQEEILAYVLGLSEPLAQEADDGWTTMYAGLAQMLFGEYWAKGLMVFDQIEINPSDDEVHAAQIRVASGDLGLKSQAEQRVLLPGCGSSSRPN